MATEYAPESRRQAAGPCLSLALQIPGNIPLLLPLRYPPAACDEGFLGDAPGSPAVPLPSVFIFLEPEKVLNSDTETLPNWVCFWGRKWPLFEVEKGIREPNLERSRPGGDKILL